jgi:hypothetical protein
MGAALGATQRSWVGCGARRACCGQRQLRGGREQPVPHRTTITPAVGCSQIRRCGSHEPLVLVAGVAAGSWFGHLGRAVLAQVRRPRQIAQPGQLDDLDRRRFRRLTLWLTLTLAVVGTITVELTAQAVRLGVGVPCADTTLIAELARIGTPAPVFAAFQAA